MMDDEKYPAWSFTIEFDEEKAVRNSYDVDTLYDYVGKSIESLGVERIGRGTWKVANAKDRVAIQCTALCGLARKKWVMENIASWTVRENDAPEGHDYLQVVREVSPQLICE